MDEALILAILHYFQEVLAELETEATPEHQLRFGVPPQELFVEQRARGTHHVFNNGEPIRKWIVSDKTITEISTIEAIRTERQLRGMYYDFGVGDFFVDMEAGLVRIGWQIGPRYGRGFVFTIKTEHDGGALLLDPKSTCVS